MEVSFLKKKNKKVLIERQHLYGRNRNTHLRADSGFGLLNWSYPYPDKNKIISINTGLSKQWKYSPKFLNVIAETSIKLTGSRREDYRIAESITGTAHVPGVSVWHHVWERDANGNYTMQLVETADHIKTCPHAGGCKLWSLTHHKIYRNKRAYSYEHSEYHAYEIDYVFQNFEESVQYKQSISVNVQRYMNRKGLIIFGLDAYGNMFLKDHAGNRYIFDHEFGKIYRAVNRIRDIRSRR